MTSVTAKDVYELLPVVHRVRDAERGYPLQALVSVLVEQAGAMADDIDGLHANWFIETCDEWVVPYIGDLLRVRRLNSAAAGMSERSYVANTIAYRRRKGTVSVIERLAYDVTGWRAKAVETFKLLGSTQNINHVRPGSLRTPDLRMSSDLELVGGPFETASHSADVRRIEPRRGRYNIPDVAVMLWRLGAYPVKGATARPVSDPSDGRFTFNSLGLDEPLFNPPRTEAELGHLATETDVPGPLRPRALHDDLQLDSQQRHYLAPGAEVLRVGTMAAKGGPVTPLQTLSICDLSDWQRPGLNVDAAVDVVRGRITLPAASPAVGVAVDYSYGFSADVGAGSYDRAASLAGRQIRTLDWQVGVIQSDALRLGAPDPQLVFATLADAINAWNNQPGGQFGRICVMDSCTYSDPLPAVTLSAGSRLVIVAASCPGLLQAGESTSIEPKALMPMIEGSVAVGGAPSIDPNAVPGELLINGLLVDGQLGVQKGDLGRLTLASSTVTRGLVIDTTSSNDALGIKDNSRLQLEVAASLCGPLVVSGHVGIGGASITDSVVDGAGGTALEAPHSDLTLSATTIFGTTAARTLAASNCIFTEPVTIEQLQAQCVRFSYIPDASAVPYAYRCQPALALASAKPAETAAINARIKPIFKSTRLGDPAYAQLLLQCAPEILKGADNGGEMGVFNQVQQPHREANLRTALDEYLRFGLEAGIFYVN